MKVGQRRLRRCFDTVLDDGNAVDQAKWLSVSSGHWGVGPAGLRAAFTGLLGLHMSSQGYNDINQGRMQTSA